MDYHEMHLHNEPYERIKSGTKKLEVRLNDEKREKVKIGDKILFYKESGGFISTTVVNLYKYDSFKELFENIDLTLLGYEPNKDKNELVERMRKYYTEEQEQKYGVLGIEIKLFD